MAAGDTLRRITPYDQWILDANGNIVGMKNPNAGGADMRLDPGVLIATGMRTAVLGDSISDTYVYGSTGSSSTRKSSGWITWLNTFAGQRFYFDQSLNFAVAGYNTSDLIANKLAACIAAKPQVCFVLIGTNDCAQLALAGTANPASVIITNLTTIYSALANAGIKVIAIPILPRSTWSGLSAPQMLVARQIQYQVNAWIRSKARYGSGIFLADPTKYWVDPASATGDPVAARVQDGLHPSSPNGGYYAGKGIWADLTGMFPGGAPLDYSGLTPTNGYDATYNPYANMLVNGTWQGTAGTVQANTTGTAPDGWITQRTSGTTGTMACSQESPRLDGLPGTRAKFICSAASGSVNEQFALLQIVSTNVTPGDTWQAAAGVDVSACVNSRNVYIQALVKNGGGSTLLAVNSGEVGAMPDESWTGVMQTEPFVIPANATQIHFYILMTVDGSLASTSMTVKPSWARLARVVPVSAFQ